MVLARRVPSPVQIGLSLINLVTGRICGKGAPISLRAGGIESAEICAERARSLLGLREIGRLGGIDHVRLPNDRIVGATNQILKNASTVLWHKLWLWS